MAKILFIDDDVQTLELMEREALILGHQAILCPTSSDALRYVHASKPDLVLIDINMQEINGFDIVLQIRKSRRVAATPVLLLSAAEPEIEGKKALQVGANGFLSKPLTIIELEKAVKTYGNHNHKHA